MRLSYAILGLFYFSGLALAENRVSIAVVDSGLDTEHEAFDGRVWINPDEVEANRRDDDANGYKDDVNGWNFANNNNQLIDYSFDFSFTPEVARFFELQSKSIKRTATMKELNELKSLASNKEVRRNLQIFGNYAHGTHVSGIAVGDNQELEVQGIKLIPTTVASNKEKTVENTEEIDGIRDSIIKAGIRQLVSAQSAIMGSIGKYIGAANIDIANLSFGMNLQAASMALKPILDRLPGGKVSSSELLNYANYMVSEAIKSQEVLFRAAPDTLFAVAAGNDARDNSEYPITPANVKADNKISVAATYKGRLAPFSNYSATLVDIAAPGTDVMSASPKDRYINMSGTSQAAPLVARAAGLIKAENPDLDPMAIKSILMGTVDKNNYLAGKVVSGGVLNLERAVYAGGLTAQGYTIEDAIDSALTGVSAAEFVADFLFEMPEFFVEPLPSGF